MSDTATTQVPQVPSTRSPTPYWWPDPRTFIIGWMMVSSFGVIVICLFHPPPSDNQLLTTLMSIYVGTGFVTSIQWWMGSSKGSEDKTRLLGEGISNGTVQ